MRASLVYGTEEYVGAAIKESGLARSDLFITTKYSGIGTAPEGIQASLDKVCSVNICPLRCSFTARSSG